MYATFAVDSFILVRTLILCRVVVHCGYHFDAGLEVLRNHRSGELLGVLVHPCPSCPSSS